MPDYDFSTLSPHDFEVLSRDLLQKEWGILLESFKSGRDRGIDLRYSRPKDTSLVGHCRHRGIFPYGRSELIVQCKHYRRSGFAKLKSVLKKDELPKIAKLKPARYVVTTSLGLSPDQKDELVRILSPYCHGPADILGIEDLNNLLGKHGEVERKHFKLWLPSTEILQRLLHNGVFTQSALEIDEIKRHLSLFVPTDAVQRSLDVLKERGFCMLTGIPGIGKTTTARILVARHVHRGWEGIYLSRRTGEAFSVFRPDTKQVFFYDDFLGQTSLEEKLPKNEDKELRQLIQACRKRPKTKRLILTTRKYLLEQAKQQHEVLSRSRIELAECTVELSDYTGSIRAQILVNHLYFYGVDSKVCSAFVQSGVAGETLDHANYNPRIVETMCEMQQNLDLRPEDFGKRFLALLDSPGEIWEHAYSNQLTPNARQLLLVFAILGNRVKVEALRSEFRIYAEQTDIGLVGFEAMFMRCLEELEDNFLTIHPHVSLAHITYHNPAVKDFTDRELGKEGHVLRVILNHLTYDLPLARAAKCLVESQAVAVSGAEILVALQRGDCQNSFRTSYETLAVTEEPPVDRVRSLRAWTNVVATLNHTETTEQMLRYIEGFIRNTEDPREHPTSFFIDLYKDYRQLAQSADTRSRLSVQDFAQRFVECCRDPEEFIALDALLNGNDGLTDLRERLRDRFPSGVYEWIGNRAQDANSSDEIHEAILSVTEAAEALGLCADDLDFSDAHGRAQDLCEKEDAEADMQQEEWEFRRSDERDQRNQINNILDSLTG